MPDRDHPATPVSPQPSGSPDYERWAAADLWTPTEAAALLLEREPPADGVIPPAEQHGRFGDLVRELEETGSRPRPDKILFYYYPLGTPRNGFTPWRVLAWADSKQFPVPELLRRAFLRSHPQACSHADYLREIERLSAQTDDLRRQLADQIAASRPPYMDRTHPSFAPCLEAAVAAWTALYEERRLVHKRAHKQQINKWLEEHRADLTPNARGVIATVANPNKRGGAPKTDE